MPIQVIRPLGIGKIRGFSFKRAQCLIKNEIWDTNHPPFICTENELVIYQSTFNSVTNTPWSDQNTNGGAVSTETASHILVQFSSFLNCSAHQRGGSMYIKNTNQMNCTLSQVCSEKSCSQSPGTSYYIESSPNTSILLGEMLSLDQNKGAGYPFYEALEGPVSLKRCNFTNYNENNNYVCVLSSSTTNVSMSFTTFSQNKYPHSAIWLLNGIQTNEFYMCNFVANIVGYPIFNFVGLLTLSNCCFLDDNTQVVMDNTTATFIMCKFAQDVSEIILQVTTNGNVNKYTGGTNKVDLVFYESPSCIFIDMFKKIPSTNIIRPRRFLVWLADIENLHLYG